MDLDGVKYYGKEKMRKASDISIKKQLGKKVKYYDKEKMRKASDISIKKQLGK